MESSRGTSLLTGIFVMKNGPIALLFNTLFVIFLLAPMVLVCLIAFTPENYLALPTNGFSLRWFQRLTERPEFFESFKTSVGIALASTVIALLFAVPAGLAIARYRFLGRAALNALFLSPLMLPHVVLGIAFLRFLTEIGISGTTTGLIIGHIVIVFPFAMRMILASASGMDMRIEDAAASLGAGRLTIYKRIILPLIVPGIASGFALSFIQSFDETTMTIFVASPTTTTLPVQMFNYIQDNIDPLICAVSALLILFTVILMVILDRLYGLERLFVGEGQA
ncbi:ABC transporter permease subunit [Agrobacterium vitis]|nr:ABC transporter permease [Allorhizobium ampelinum]MUO31354.1 ABC transporter permease subunit [Agrobacterium vitis]MCF1450245.1 ABC transporter permease [Allorhizobium ampelinum]MCF1495926.1 ABC transporter permease [Allorhizobium ampelinum]MUO45182.1 ABC transporter permease subunit [Agrobacterium vitis]